MYDTLSLWLPLTKVEFLTTLSHLPLNLQNSKETYDHTARNISISGNFNSMYFNIKEAGLFINGSLSKYHFGNNQQTLTINDTKEAIENLCKFTQLPINDSSAYRIDFAENYIVTQPESQYYNYLGDSTYYVRSELNNGLYYSNQRRQLVFYGKIHEQKLKKQLILPVFNGKNVLRYEMRLKRKIPYQIGLSKIKASMLYEPTFYKKMLEKYQSEYFSISKKHHLMLDRNIITEKNGLINQILLLGANALGGEDEIFRMIEIAKGNPRFSNAMQVRRMKQKIKSIFKIPILTKPSDLIKELDEKILIRIQEEILSL